MKREWHTEIVSWDSIDSGIEEALNYIGVGAVPVSIALVAIDPKYDQISVTVLADVPEEGDEILRRPASPA